MEDEESTQGHLPGSRPTLQKSGHKITENGGLIQDFDTHCRRPESPLIPWKEIACKTKCHHNTEQRQADHPEQFSGFFICAPEKDLRHVRKDTDDHGAGAPEMIAQHEPPIIDIVNNVLRTGIRMVGGRHIIEHQQNAGHRLHGEDEQQNGAKDVGPTGAARNRLVQHLGLHVLEADTFVEKGNELFDRAGLLIRGCWGG